MGNIVDAIPPALSELKSFSSGVVATALPDPGSCASPLAFTPRGRPTAVTTPRPDPNGEGGMLVVWWT